MIGAYWQDAFRLLTKKSALAQDASQRRHWRVDAWRL
jgi:hypothetical protein